MGPRPARTNRKVRCRCVRNVSGITLLPKRLATFQLSAGSEGYGARVDGYVCTTAQRGYPVDEWLPNGVVNNDLFWLVVDGPSNCLLDLAAGANNVITVGDPLIGLTAATSQATSAGRLYSATLNASTVPLANQAMNYVGYALSAAVTTSTEVLAEVGHW